jgi:hypothetical protein
MSTCGGEEERLWWGARVGAPPQPATAPTTRTSTTIALRPRIRRDYPLNLSISVSGGKETNEDSPSNGE